MFPTSFTSPFFLVIEGAPGIGKTVLSKEIAYQWAKKMLLECKKLVFLLFLRDPSIKKLKSLENLIQYLFEGTKVVSSVLEYLFQSKGEDLVVIFDGYDEMSEEDRNNSLLAKIINRNVLPKCDLIITSRPSASLYLRDVADCRVEVLGFTEKDRLDYIQHALEGSDNKIKALRHYLQSNSTINALCYIPLNMTILLCLFEEMNTLPRNMDLESTKKFGLPNSQTEMYEKFILITITRFLKRQNKPVLGKYLKITQLPEPYNKVFNELVYLAYYAFKKDDIVFNLNDEIVEACPFLKSNNWEGLDLLKVTEHINNVSFRFLHFSIQEYLAAYYIASQPYGFQAQLLQDTFWDIRYYNTWIMYVGITDGKKEAWKHFIYGNTSTLLTKMFGPPEICKSFLNDKIKSLYLFQCFAEIGNKELVFKDSRIDLSHQTLLPKDIGTICFLLFRSVNKHWLKLDLSYCKIRDTGSDILCKTFLDKSRSIVSIDKVDLSHNQLQTHTMLRLLDVINIWQTSEAYFYEDCMKLNDLFEICLNKFLLNKDEDFSQRLYIGPFIFAHNIQFDIHNQLTDLTNITTGLYLNYCKYPSMNFGYEELSHKLNLSNLHIIGENIQSNLIGIMVKKIKEVHSVYIYDHTLSDEDVKYLSLMLLKTKASDLGVWIVIGRTKILGNIPDMLTLNKRFSTIEISNLSESIKRICSGSNVSASKFDKNIEIKNAYENLFCLLHKNISRCEISFCLLKHDILIANRVKCTKINESSSNNNLTSIFIAKSKLNLAELVILISKQESIEKLYILDSFLEIYNFKYENLLHIQTLKELFIHISDNGSSCTSTFDLLEFQRTYSNVSLLFITNNILIGHNPTCEQILLSLQLEGNWTVWKISDFPINSEMLHQIVDALSNVVELDLIGYNLGKYRSQHNIVQNADSICKLLSHFTGLKILRFYHNDLQEAGAGKIFKNLKKLNLTKLNISYNEISEKAVDDIAELLSQTAYLVELDLSCNELPAAGMVKILNKMQSHASNFTRLNISKNGLNDDAAHGIAIFLFHNPQLKELDLSCNYLQAAGTIKICEAMRCFSSLTKLNVSNNNISGEAANDLGAVLLQNSLLEELNLSYNNFGILGSSHIIHTMEKMSHLVKLNISNIGITNTTIDDIVTVLNNNNKLEELTLSHNNINAVGATIIFKKTSIKNLHKFNISHNNITDDVDYMEAFLSMNTNLEELDLSHNHLQAASIINICKANLTKLTILNISHNNFATGSANYIGTFLSHNTQLQKLDLSGNNLQESDYTCLFKNLQFTLSNLSSLRISYSNIINKAADELSTFLLHNTTLQEFDLSYNNLSMLDVVKIFNGMRHILNLKTINVSHSMITDGAADALANVLLHNIKLKDINLSFNNLSASGIVRIFEGMKNISTLETINISHNMITDEASEKIGTVLSLNSNLKSLDISSNYFTSKGLVKFFDCLKNAFHVRKLTISCIVINSEAAHSIAAVLSRDFKLKELNLGNNLMQTSSIVIIFSSLRNFTNLKKIHINENMITDEAADDIAAVLSQNTQLEELNISCNNLQTAGIVKIFGSIKDTPTLKRLNFSHNMIIDEAATYIVDVLISKSNLKELNLGHTNLKISTACTSLKFVNVKLANLTHCNFSGNNIDEKLAHEISCLLSHCTNLQVLDLSFTNLQDSHCIQILNSLITINLRTFDISGNFITTHGAANIGALLSNNDEINVINLSYNNLEESGIRNLLNSINLSNLCSLNISNNCIAGDLKDVTDTLIHATKLVQLNLGYNQLSADYVKYLLYQMKNKFTNAIQLYLPGNIVGPEVTEALANVLSDNITLKELDLSDNNLNEQGISRIFYRLKVFTLIKLNISHNNINAHAADCIATFLSVNTNLKELDLSHNVLQSAGAIKICGINISYLIALNLSYNEIAPEAANSIVTFLSRNPKLEKLDLSYNKLQSAGIIMICKANLLNLTALNISNNNITVEAADDIATFLYRNTKLQGVDLSYSDLQETGCRNIFKVLKNTNVLTSLKISNCNVMNEAVDELGVVLLNNISLQKLDLSCNNLLKSESLKIFKEMKNITGLVALNVGHNNIIDEAADELANLLLHKIKLQELDLSYNNLSAPDAVNIFKKLDDISSLVAINLSHNTITADAADSIANILSNNSNLQTLNLSFNSLRSEGANKIFNRVKNIICLRRLNVSHNNITFDAVESIVAIILSHDTNLEELDISYNNLQTPGAIKIFESFKHTSTLTKLNIANNMINDGATDYIMDVLCNNNRLEEINISNNDLLEINVITKAVISKLSITNESTDKQIANRLSIFVTNLQRLNLSNINPDAFASFEEIDNIFTLKWFDISANSLHSCAASYIAKFLSKNGELKELDLSHNDLQESGIIIILGAVRCSNLRKLNISSNNANLKDTVEVLLQSTQLVELNLSYNKLNNAADAMWYFSKLKNIFSNLAVFNISSICHEIDDEAATALANIFSLNTNLKELDLSDNNLFPKAIIKIINELNTSNLIKFNISRNNITDKAADCIAAFLSRNIDLQVIDMSHNNLSSTGAIKICKTNISKLTTFKINHNSITDEAANDIASFLSHNNKLQILDLSCNSLQEAGCKSVLKALQDIDNLISLKISNCHATNEAADEVANVLLNNPALQEIDLSCNNISTYFAKVFKGMGNISNLVSVNISHNTITEEALPNLANIFHYNTSLKILDLSYNNLSTLSTINIFKEMKNISKLEAINISHNNITDEAAESIAAVLSHNSNLQVLDMSCNHLGSKGCNKICNGMKTMFYLHSLDISYNEITCEATENIATVLFQNAKMKAFDISHNNLQAQGAVKIFEGIKYTSAITNVNIAHNMISNEAANEIFDILYTCSKLKEFNLSHNDLLEIDVITKIIVSKLSKSDDLLSEQAANMLSIIITSIPELDLSNLDLQTKGIIKGFDGLGSISSLTKFNICKNLIDPLAANILAKFLSKNGKLQELNLSHNDLQAEGIKTILSEVNFRNLILLNINDNNVNLCVIKESLSYATNLTELDLSYNKMNNAVDAMMFFSALKNSLTNLMKLYISGICQEINNEAVEELVGFLSQNNTLKELDLSSNNIHPEAASKIFVSLSNSTLSKLNISHNMITDEVTDNIANFLINCTNLKVLDLSHNSLQDDGALQIFYSIKNLTSIDFRCNKISSTAEDVITFYVSYYKLSVQVLW